MSEQGKERVVSFFSSVNPFLTMVFVKFSVYSLYRILRRFTRVGKNGNTENDEKSFIPQLVLALKKISGGLRLACICLEIFFNTKPLYLILLQSADILFQFLQATWNRQLLREYTFSDQTFKQFHCRRFF